MPHGLPMRLDGTTATERWCGQTPRSMGVLSWHPWRYRLRLSVRHDEPEARPKSRGWPTP
jgi:hypothetical protein